MTGSHPDDLPYRSIAELQVLMSDGELTALELTRYCLQRIETLDRQGPALCAVIETNPDAEKIAVWLDDERRSSSLRGPLHGIPVLLKDNVDTADAMETTAGSLALLGSPPPRDAMVASCLRQAGAVLLGKTNMSEWAHFRSEHSLSGWSARGGRTRNPYVLDRSPQASSSGSAVALAAGYAPASIGTETWGSIVEPAAVNSVVGLKPTVGLTSRAGVIPISSRQDSVGPLARTVRDAGAVLNAIAGPDRRDPASAAAPSGIDYTHFPAVAGMRVGVPRTTFFGLDERVDRLVDTSIDALHDAGVAIVEDVEIPSAQAIREFGPMFELLLHEFRRDLTSYLAERSGDIRDLADLIAFNEAHAAQEMPFFGQEMLIRAQSRGLDERAYRHALALNQRLAREQGIDAALATYHLDALIGPSTWLPVQIDSHPSRMPDSPIDGPLPRPDPGSPATLAAMAGYPAVTVPVGYVGELPTGMLLMGTAWSERVLLALAHTVEQALNIWRPPRFLETV